MEGNVYEYEEVPSKRGGTLYLTPDNQHLYRTNNSVESLNKRWNVKVGIRHPNFWHLSELIWEDLEVTFIID